MIVERSVIEIRDRDGRLIERVTELRIGRDVLARFRMLFAPVPLEAFARGAAMLRDWTDPTSAETP